MTFSDVLVKLSKRLDNVAVVAEFFSEITIFQNVV